MGEIKKYWFNSILLFFVLIACGPPKHITNDFSLFYKDDKVVGRDIPINTYGFYSVAVVSKKTEFDKPNLGRNYESVQDTFYMNYIFFPDGFFVKNVSSCNPDCTKKEFKEIDQDSLNQRIVGFNNSCCWGVYGINKDTLITQSINNPSPPKVWSAFEVRFRVLDRNTIVQVSTKVLGKYPNHNVERWEQKEANRKYSQARFIPLTQLPKAMPWLKNEKWLWKDKLKYKTWKKQNR